MRFAVCVLMVAIVGCGGNARVPVHLIRTADRVDLLSLDPVEVPDEPPKTFHGFRVLGSLEVVGDTKRDKLTEELERGLNARDLAAAECFWPRHGVRIKKAAKVTDLLICFQCKQVKVIEPDKPGKVHLIADTPQPALDAILKDAGIPLPSSDPPHEVEPVTTTD